MLVHLTHPKDGRRFVRATSTVCQRRLPEPYPDGDPDVVSVRVVRTTKTSSKTRQWRMLSLPNDHRCHIMKILTPPDLKSAA